MENEKLNWKSAVPNKEYGCFIEYFNHSPNQHMITVMGQNDGKRVVIGRIFQKYDAVSKKYVYTALDGASNPIFQDITDLTTLKKNFKEHAKTLAMVLLKSVEQEKEADLKERENNLKNIREQKEKNQTKGKEI
jgi:hypothetical protein